MRYQESLSDGENLAGDLAILRIVEIPITSYKANNRSMS
jgi:hypothetical protein